MPRYYFHIRDGNGVTEDREGIELPGIDAARPEALKRACRIWSERPPESTDNDEMFEVADETGRIVLTVPFSEAFAERAAT